MRIRPATPEDADSLAEVYRSAYQETRELGFPMKAADATAADIRRWMDDGRLLVAVSADEPIGAVRIEGTNDGSLKVSRLAVHEDHQAQGVGSRLMDAVESIASEKGLEAVRLTTPPEHPYLPAFYRGRGYERVAEYPLAYREYDEIVMELDLDAPHD